MKERLQLYKVCDPYLTGTVDIIEIIKIFEGDQKGISEKTLQLILEKLSTAFFYNDISLKRAFEFFDLDKDDVITKAEFHHGMSKLDFGLSNFEIK